jgi:hypothetical protein
MRTSASSADLKHFQLTLQLYHFHFMNTNSSKRCVCSIVLVLKWPRFYAPATHNTWQTGEIRHHMLARGDQFYLLRYEIYLKYSHTDFFLRSLWKVPKICPAEKTLSSSPNHTARWYEFSLWFVSLHTHTRARARAFHISNICRLTVEYETGQNKKITQAWMTKQV